MTYHRSKSVWRNVILESGSPMLVRGFVMGLPLALALWAAILWGAYHATPPAVRHDVKQHARIALAETGAAIARSVGVD